jgi:hypothetical protein
MATAFLLRKNPVWSMLLRILCLTEMAFLHLCS